MLTLGSSPVEGIAAAGGQEHRVHSKGRGRAEDRPDICGIHDILKDSNPVFSLTDLRHRRQDLSLHGAEQAAG